MLCTVAPSIAARLPFSSILRVPISGVRVPAETSKRELMLDAELTAPFDEARLHRRHDVLGTTALHMTTVSR